MDVQKKKKIQWNVKGKNTSGQKRASEIEKDEGWINNNSLQGVEKEIFLDKDKSHRKKRIELRIN